MLHWKAYFCGHKQTNHAIDLWKHAFTVLLWGELSAMIQSDLIHVWIWAALELLRQKWNALPKLHLVRCVLVHKSNGKLHLRQSPHPCYLYKAHRGFFCVVDDRFNWLLQTSSLSEPVKLPTTTGEEKAPAPFKVQLIHLSGVFYMRRFWEEKKTLNIKSAL